MVTTGTGDTPIERVLPYDTPVLSGVPSPVPSCTKNGPTVDMKDIQPCLSSSVKLRREHPLVGVDGKLYVETTVRSTILLALAQQLKTLK